MNAMPLSKIAAMCGATILQGDAGAKILRISKDTRDIQPGDLYVALRGEHYDGNAFVADAASRGAAGALCDGDHPGGLPAGFAILTTPDSIAALTLLASSWRSELPLNAVVVTGSSGKTSVKDMTASVLGARCRVTSTTGNLNNQIGLPLSILKAVREDEAAVWEIGMNHRGEISPLAGLARPRIAVVTGVGTAHIEHLGSREEIAREKGDLLEKLPQEGFGVIPAEDDFASQLKARTNARVLGVGFGCGDVRAEIFGMDLGGSHFRVDGVFGSAEVHLPVPGKHMVGNAMMALVAGCLSGVSLDEGAEALALARLAGGRLTRIVHRGATLLDDTYNANPDSMVAALETVAAMDVHGRKIAVLGKMGELGVHATAGYRRVGVKAAGSIDEVICVGSEAAAIAEAAAESGCLSVLRADDNAAAAALLSERISEGDLVLLKGSRSARMEEILQLLD